MRKILLVAGVFALAGCEAESDVADADAEATTEEVAEVDPAVGSYRWTDDDGTEVTGHLLADGTAYTEANGERQDPVRWARNEEGQVCIHWEGGVDDDGEAYEAGSDCMTFGEVAEDGTLEITNADGSVDTVVKIS